MPARLVSSAFESVALELAAFVAAGLEPAFVAESYHPLHSDPSG